MRYAVVGAGHIAQNAVLPAFRNARRNSVLTAIISGNPRKRAQLREMYGVDMVCDYEEYSDACASGAFDAVYLALPNSMHWEFACRAAAAGVHVLCEKPMATSSSECAAMINAARAAGVKLMVAYRLHFEAANLRAIEIARSGALGDLRLFNSVFSMQVRRGNIRLQGELGGGPLFDLGIYCINAARYIFRAEPEEVTAFAAYGGGDPRFAEVERSVSAVLRFPGSRLASFTCSFGAAEASYYQVFGTEGDLRVEPAFGYEGELKHRLTTQGSTRERTFRRSDQFAPELLYFSECIQRDREPEPGAIEGLIDVRIIEAIYRSIRAGQSIEQPRLPHDDPPTPDQYIRRPPAREPRMVEARSPRAD